MHKLLKILIFFIINCLLLSITSAYNITSIEKGKWDTIVWIIEQKISQNGEWTRQIYIKSLNKFRTNKSEKIKGIIDYVIYNLDTKSYDLSYLFSDEKINTNSNKCIKSTTNINWTSYEIPILSNWKTYTINYTTNTENGTIDYYNIYTCENGVLNTNQNKIYIKTNCNSGYSWWWSGCIKDTVSNKNCSNVNYRIGNHIYQIAEFKHWTSIQEWVKDWIQSYSQKFSCNNWAITVNWAEILSNVLSYDCPYTTQHVGDHTYPITDFFNWTTLQKISDKVYIQNWYQTFIQNFSCNNWNITTVWSEIMNFTCNSWYSAYWTSCVLSTDINNDSATVSNLWFEKTYWDLKKWDIVQIGAFKVTNNNIYNTYNIDVKLESWAITGWLSTKSRLTFSDIYFVDDNWYKYNSTISKNTNNFLNIEIVDMWALNYKVFWIVNEATPWNDEIITTINSLVWKNTWLYDQKIWKITVWK
jgi:hypothetical protein